MYVTNLLKKGGRLLPPPSPPFFPFPFFLSLTSSVTPYTPKDAANSFIRVPLLHRVSHNSLCDGCIMHTARDDGDG